MNNKIVDSQSNINKKFVDCVEIIVSQLKNNNDKIEKQRQSILGILVIQIVFMLILAFEVLK